MSDSRLNLYVNITMLSVFYKNNKQFEFHK